MDTGDDDDDQYDDADDADDAVTDDISADADALTERERAEVERQTRIVINSRPPSDNRHPLPSATTTARRGNWAPIRSMADGTNASFANAADGDEYALSSLLALNNLDDDDAMNDGVGANDVLPEVETVEEVYELCRRGSPTAYSTRSYRDNVLLETLVRFEQRWIYPQMRPSERAQYAARCLMTADNGGDATADADAAAELDLDHIVTNIQAINSSASSEINRVMFLCTIFECTGTFVELQDGARVKERFDRLLSMITVGRDYLIDCARAYNASLEFSPGGMPTDVSRYRFSMYNAADLTDSQSLLVHVLRYIRDNNFRRIGDLVYSEVSYTYRGRVVNTHAWKVCLNKFEELVRAATPRHIMFEQWNNLTKHPGSMDFVVKYLRDARQDEFPTLTPDRRIFAFRNGIFVCGVDEDVREHYLLQHPEERNLAVCLIENVFYRWRDPNFPGTAIACNFIDQEFDTSVTNYDDPFDIATPNFDRILTYQNFDAAEHGADTPIMRWLYALGVGRMLYDVRDRDRWECLLFLKGIAGSGKSTCSEILSTLYPKNKIGVVSNRIEKQFGLGALCESWVWVAKDLKSNFGIDQGDLQSMITGEEVSVAIKHQTARSLIWTTPGLVLGNETANWIDASGSMTRRLVLVDFARRVAAADVDTDLFKKIRLETPRILFKANAMYLEYTKRYRDRQIWDVLPQYFLKQREAIQGILNPLVAFLSGESSEIVLGQNESVPFDDLASLYKTFCRVRNFSGMIRFNEDHYRDVFAQHNITVINKDVTWRGRDYVDTKFVFGVGIVHGNGHDI